MTETTEVKNRGGRPATGETPKRQVRVGEEWDEAERLAVELAKHMGWPKASVAAYVKNALRMENLRVAKLINKESK